MGKRLIFLLGGARSGKSSYAETWARGHGPSTGSGRGPSTGSEHSPSTGSGRGPSTGSEHSESVLFVATAQARDDEMRERIAAHQAGRPAQWRTLEAPLKAGAAIRQLNGNQGTIVIDCLTLLASNALLQLPDDCTQAQADEAVLAEVEGLLHAYAESTATWLVISNEVGMGLVPPYRLGRLYRDALGRANQHLARHADEVLLLVAGLPWRLRGEIGD